MESPCTNNMDPISCAISTEVPLPISLLSELGRGSLRAALGNVDGTQDVSGMLIIWHKLVLTATSPRVADKHMTAAANALCVYLHGAAQSNAVSLREFVLSHDVWFEVYHCVHKAFHDGKTKRAKQIMETLCELLALQNDPEVIAEVLRRTSLPLVRVVLLSLPRSEIKKACLILAFLFRKTPLLEQLDQLIQNCRDENRLLWTQRLSQHNLTMSDTSSIGQGNIPHFLLALIFAMTDLDTRSGAIKVCSLLCSESTKSTTSSGLQVPAERAIQLYLERNHAVLGDFAENVLPVILDSKQKFMAFVQPYSKSCQESGPRTALFIAILKVGRAKSILTEPAFPPLAPNLNDETKWQYWCKRMLMSADSQVRTLTYGLLVSSPATNALILPETLECIATSLKYLHDDAGAHERGEILSITKRLLRRLQSSISTLRKPAQLIPSGNDVTSLLHAYSSFTMSFYGFLKGELNTGISYPRHILGLQSLQHLLDLGFEPASFARDDCLLKTLICLVLDPFEDVRSTAAAILQRLAAKDDDLIASAIGHGLLKKIEALVVRTLRADHADGMGRLSAFINMRPSLNEPLQDFRFTDLAKDANYLEQSTAGPGTVVLRPGCAIPIHALLLATSYRLRYLGREDALITSIRPTIVRVCENVWEQVRHQLCVDSPETAFEPEDEMANEGPKDLLAYSWRALRDSSLVLQSLILVSTLSQELCSAVGGLCMDQLISLRHRGAFSTVAQTFSQCCDKVRLSAEPDVRGLIHKWYQIALNQINEQANRLTRRSAGLPAMIAALLSPVDLDYLSSAVNDLMVIAERAIDGSLNLDIDDVKLPQVHALNCLKEIMTNSKFAVVVVQHLERMMELAATCLSSKVWAIRNCGLMLLRACINRLDTSSMGEVVASTDRSNEKGENSAPLTIALRLFDASASDINKDGKKSDTELVFAGLDLLGHTIFEGSEADEAAQLVTKHLMHSTWPVRDRAALLLATGILRGNPAAEIKKLLMEIGLSGPENQVHGILLCCRYLMRRATGAITCAELESILEYLIDPMVSSNEGLVPHSPYVCAAWLDLLSDAASCVLENQWASDVRGIQRLQGHFPRAAQIDPAHYAYLSGRILLCKTYHILTRDQNLDSRSKEVRNLASQFLENIDALGFVLDVLSQKHGHNPPRIFLDLLICLVEDRSQHSFLPPAILEQMFICLEQCLNYITDISIDVLRTLYYGLDLSQIHTTRDLRNATLKLQASLLGRMHTAPAGSFTETEYLEAWLHDLQDISTDYFDYSTRLSAITAISTYIERLQPVGALELRSSFRMRLLLVLYDLLNDDDDEIRFEATHAARGLQLQQLSANDNVGSSALAARESLLSELSRQFGQTSSLSEAAIVKIMSIGQIPSDSSSHVGPLPFFDTSLSSRLQSISKSKNDLFAEERQNLYMDDIREIKEWTEILHDGNYSFQTRDLSRSVMKWTLEGLEQVLQVLEADRIIHLGPEDITHKDTPFDPLLEPLFLHPLGVTYDHTVLVLMVQVVSLAGVLIQVLETQQMRATLEKIQGICRTSRVNPVMLGAVERALRGE
ncbi:hypothetical protein Z517_07769 [Fonsecaea pedrosoi CBS 271.37]|uniref:Unplaced genomic scaffold supercont1.5, whole genome shotgun sequence n=1 Tax=Fonsecaea pedrosoi CBS 271.37 TaxID=1442368 RepID=A0A0D2DJX9_9EURO|nr:uncharacterized protein Z517_07769 [Fonsecaea pedrosoi CBS 271.37]KIW77936.1 hypothetical protein Z517_07769 [Fonsecaea pedrosoi CBS 271.37]